MDSLVIAGRSENKWALVHWWTAASLLCTVPSFYHFCLKPCEALSLHELVKVWDNVEHFHCVSVPQPFGVVMSAWVQSHLGCGSQWFFLPGLLVKGVKKFLSQIWIIISATHLFMSIHHTTHCPFLQRKDTGNISNTDNGYKGICK